MIDKQTIEYFKNHKDLITLELLNELRKTKEGKQFALDMLDLPKDDEGYYLDSFNNRISFNGDRGLKKEYTKLTLTKIHLDEIERCAQSLNYFKDNYVKIKTPTSGVNFPDLRVYQNEFLNKIENGKEDSIIGLMGRQSGKSISTSIYLAHKFIFFENMSIGICANRGDLAREFLNNTKNILMALPIWMQQGIRVWNKGRIEAENGMRILTDVPNENAFRGYTCNILVVDECAFIKSTKYKEFEDSIFPSQGSLSWKKNIILSTANGMNHFYQMVKGARTHKMLYDVTEEELKNIHDEIIEKIPKENGLFNVELNKSSNGYDFFEVDWRDVPRYDKKGKLKDPEKFKEEIIEKYGLVYFNQNYANEFIGSSYTLVNSDTLSNLLAQEPESIKDNMLKIFKKPIKNHKYIMSVDPSKDGLDGFAIQVIDITNIKFEQVASCSLNIDYLKMPEYIVEWGKYYNYAFLIIENNEGAGQSIADIIFNDYEYENMYFDKIVNANSSLNIQKRKRYPGFRTTPKSRKLILDTLKLFLENGKLIINDFETINEFYRFILINGKYQADEGCHDDLVMSLAISFAPFCNTKNFSDIKKLISDIYSKDEESTDDFTDLLQICHFDDFSDENVRNIVYF